MGWSVLLGFSVAFRGPAGRADGPWISRRAWGGIYRSAICIRVFLKGFWIIHTHFYLYTTGLRDPFCEVPEAYMRSRHTDDQVAKFIDLQERFYISTSD